MKTPEPFRGIGQKREVFIVEDEGVTALHFVQTVETLGYAVSGVAHSGEEALQMIEQHPPDIVLMDVSLQGEMSGTQTGEILRRRMKLPVVFVTAYDNPATLEEVRMAGGDALLTKPLKVKELEIALRSVLEFRDRNASLNVD